MSTGIEVLGYLILFLACFISGSAGVGGGGLYVPTFLIIFTYSFDTSSSYSLFVVFGNAIAQVFINLRRRHPKNDDKSIIYWDLVILMLPAQIGGSVVGYYSKYTMPSTLLYLIALFIVCYAIFNTSKKAYYRYKLENDIVLSKRSNRIPANSIFSTNSTISESEKSNRSDFDISNSIPSNHIITNGIRSDSTRSNSIRSNSLSSNSSTSSKKASIKQSLIDSSHSVGIEVYSMKQSIDQPIRQFSKQSEISNPMITEAADGELVGVFGQTLEQSITNDTSNNLNDHINNNDNLDNNIKPIIRSTDKPKIKPMLWPVRNLTILCTGYIIYEGLNIGASLSIQCSSNFFLYVVFSYVPLLSITSYFISYIPTYQQQHSIEMVLEENIRFIGTENRYKMFTILCYTGVIGVICSLVGIGGGELIGPMLLSLSIQSIESYPLLHNAIQNGLPMPTDAMLTDEMLTDTIPTDETKLSHKAIHLRPEVTSATSSILEMATTLSSIIRFLLSSNSSSDLSDSMVLNAIIFLVIGFIGGLSGRYVSYRIIQRYHRSSWIIVTLVMTLVISALAYIVRLSISQPAFNFVSYC